MQHYYKCAIAPTHSQTQMTHLSTNAKANILQSLLSATKLIVSATLDNKINHKKGFNNKKEFSSLNCYSCLY